MVAIRFLLEKWSVTIDNITVGSGDDNIIVGTVVAIRVLLKSGGYNITVEQLVTINNITDGKVMTLRVLLEKL